MIAIVIANVIMLIASAIMIYTGYIKTKSTILILQIIQFTLFDIAYLLLEGYTGVIICVLGIIRNLLCYSKKLNFITGLLLIISCCMLTLLFNNYTVIGLFPIIDFILLTIFINTKDICLFKWVNIISIISFLFYDFILFAFVNALFDALTIITNLISIYQLKYKQPNKRSKEVD